MNELKRIKWCLGAILVLMLLNIKPLNISATESNSVLYSGVSGDINWEISSEGVLTLSGSGDYELIDYYDENGDWHEAPEWSQYSDYIKSAIVDINYLTVADKMFFGLSQMESVDLQNLNVDNLTDTEFMFKECQSLRAVEIPLGVNVIGPYTFFGCEALVNVKIPLSVHYIGECAFGKCRSLESIEIPSSVYYIGKYAFLTCQSLKSIEIPSSVYYIGEYAFLGCLSLKSIEIPSEIERIKEGTFFQCGALEDVKIPSNVTTIEKEAFEYCRNLKSVEIPSSVTFIGDRAFACCYSLVSVEILENVTSIDENAFLGVPLIHNMSSASGSPWGAKEVHDYPVNKCRICKGSEYYTVSFTGLVDEIYCNTPGDCVLPVALTLGDGSKLLDPVTVEYKIFNKPDTHKIVAKDGVILIPLTSGMYEEGEEINITFSNISDDYEIGNSTETVKVYNKELSYTEELDMNLEFKMEGELANVLGISTSPSFGVSMELEEDDGNSTLTLKRDFSKDIGLQSGVSMKSDLFKAQFGSVMGESETTDTRSMVIENFDTELNEEEQASAIGYFFLTVLSDDLGKATAMELSKLYYDMYGDYVTSYESAIEESKYSLELDANTQITANLGGVKNSLSASGGAVKYSTSIEDDLREGETTYSSSAEKTSKGLLLEGNWLLPVVKSSLWSSQMSQNETDISVAYHGDELDELSIKAIEKDYDEIIGSKVSTTEETVITYEDDAAFEIINEDVNLKKLAEGKPTLISQEGISDIYSVAYSSDQAAKLQNNIKYETELKCGISRDIGKAASIELSGSGSKSYKFETGQGAVYNGESFLAIDNSDYFPEGITYDLGYSGPEMASLGLKGIASFLGDAFVYQIGQLADGVKDKTAEVWSDFSSWVVSITSVNSMGVSTYSAEQPMILSVGEDIVQREAFAIGDAYIINIYEDDTLNTMVTEEELAKEKVYIKLAYTDEDLLNAGLNSENEDNIMIYRWDEESGIYRPLSDCKLDKEENIVTATVEMSGEYILAVDVDAPVVSEFVVSDSTVLPKIVAKVSDFSGIAECILIIDGKEVLDKDTFSEYFNEKDGLLEYQLEEELPEGNHEASVTFGDTNGNVMNEAVTIEWNVDDGKPVINLVEIPESIEEDEDLQIQAEVSDTNLEKVYAKVFDGSDSIYYELAYDGTRWSRTLSDPIFEEALTITIIAYDESGNKTISEPHIITWAIDKHWKQDNVGWWYQNDDGTYPHNCWKEIDGEWYYFNASGYRVEGWLKLSGTWYYFGKETGIMYADEWLDNTYYFQPSGAMVTGWLDMEGDWYYSNASGAKVANSWVGSYWLDADGVMATSAWVDNGQSYVNTSGIYQTGWLLLDGDWYYLGTNGVLQKGWIKVGGTWYYGDKADGRIYEQEWLDDTYYFKDGGAMVTGWYLLNGDYYYFAGSGAKITNQWIGNYYLKADGKMAVSEWIDGYYVGSDGAWIPGFTR